MSSETKITTLKDATDEALCRWEDADGKVEFISNSEWMRRYWAGDKVRKLQAFLKHSNIAPIFYESQLSDYKVANDTQRRALKAVSDMITNKRGKVALLGKNGLGKTMLSSIAARELRGNIFSMLKLTAAIKATFKKDSAKSEFDVLDELAELPFLAIDEVEKSYGTQSEHNWLSYIIDARHVNKRPTIIAGNLTAEGFAGKMTGDVLSRFSDSDSTVIVLDGEDYRRQK